MTLAGLGKSGLTSSTNRILDAFVPQIQNIVAKQAVKGSIEKVQAAVHDDVFMTKFFGAVYDCIPKPVYRFVREQDFIQFCLLHRRRLLGMEPGPAPADSLKAVVPK